MKVRFFEVLSAFFGDDGYLRRELRESSTGLIFCSMSREVAVLMRDG
jgi:hypothetical protein